MTYVAYVENNLLIMFFICGRSVSNYGNGLIPDTRGNFISWNSCLYVYQAPFGRVSWLLDR